MDQVTQKQFEFYKEIRRLGPLCRRGGGVRVPESNPRLPSSAKPPQRLRKSSKGADSNTPNAFW